MVLERTGHFVVVSVIDFSLLGLSDHLILGIVGATTFGAMAPVDDFGFIDIEASGVCWFKAGGVPAAAVNIDHAPA